MARTMVRRAITDRIPFRWVTADAAYGYSKGWRFELEQADVFHVMATTRHDTVVTRWSIDHPVHDLFPGLPRQAWKRRSCGQGAHGPRVYDWARVEVRPWHREDRRHWVIARRGVRRPEEISYTWQGNRRHLFSRAGSGDAPVSQPSGMTAVVPGPVAVSRWHHGAATRHINVAVDSRLQPP